MHIMITTQTTTHNRYCSLMCEKAEQPSRMYSVRSEVTRKTTKKGIKTHNMSKAMLARQLASLF